MEQSKGKEYKGKGCKAKGSNGRGPRGRDTRPLLVARRARSALLGFRAAWVRAAEIGKVIQATSPTNGATTSHATSWKTAAVAGVGLGVEKEICALLATSTGPRSDLQSVGPFLNVTGILYLRLALPHCHGVCRTWMRTARTVLRMSGILIVHARLISACAANAHLGLVNGLTWQRIVLSKL